MVARAAQAVGKSATSAYNLGKRPGAAAFARAWDVAQQMGQDRQFEQVMERALEGYEAPRFYAGRQVGTVRRFDNRLAMAMLRAMDLSAPAPVAPELQAEVDWLLGGDPQTPMPTANIPPIATSSTTSPASAAPNAPPIAASSTTSKR